MQQILKREEKILLDNFGQVHLLREIENVYF